MQKLLAMLVTILFPTLVWAGSAGSCGGPGLGTTTKTLDCGTSGYMVGVRGRGGGYVESIQLICRKLVNGSLEEKTYLTSVAGKQNAVTNYEGMGANRSQAVKEIETHCGTFVDRIDNLWFDLLTNGQRSWCGGDAGVCGDYVNGGGTAGFPKRLTCPAGELMHKLVVKSGLWVDNITAYCRKP